MKCYRRLDFGGTDPLSLVSIKVSKRRDGDLTFGVCSRFVVVVVVGVKHIS